MAGLTYPFTAAQLWERIAQLKANGDSYKYDFAVRSFQREYKQDIVNEWRTPEADELENLGWEPWLKTLAPHVFTAEFEDFDRKFWDWAWFLLRAKQAGHRLVSLGRPLAYLETLARSLGKSTKVEWLNIMMGALLGQTLGLYISSTGKLAAGHLSNIREEIEGSHIEKLYPGLAKPKFGKFNNRYGWNQDLLATESGFTLFAVGLEGEVRGVKRMQLRPSLLALDEFDSKDDSPDVVKKKEGIIGGSIFGTQVADTMIVMVQNLIHANSVASRTSKRRNELLADREESGLIRAFTDDLEIEPDGVKWRVTRGRPVSSRIDMVTFHKFLNSVGPVEIWAEYMHIFDRNREGKVMHNWNDGIEVITEEEFCRAYGLRWQPGFRMPYDWYKYFCHDKARTKTEYHANVAATLAVSSQNTKLPGITFMYDCLSFDENTEPDDCAIAFLRCISPKVVVGQAEQDWSEMCRSLISRENIGQYATSVTGRIQAERAVLARIVPQYVRPLIAAYNYRRFTMSAEATDWADVYEHAFGFPFERPAITQDAGQALINLAMKIDENTPDPFGRIGYWSDDKQTFIRDPDNHSGKAQLLMGMSRFYMIVKAEYLRYPNDAKPHLLHGSDLARYQFNEQRYLQPKMNALGEEERGAEKKNDDYRQALQQLYADNSVRGRELNESERREAHLPPAIQAAAVASANPDERQSLVHAQQIEMLRQQEASRLARTLGGKRSGNPLSAFKKLNSRGI
jgi:hypothetical protein